MSNGLSDLFGPTFLAKIQTSLSELPRDREGGFSYDRLDMSVSSTQVEAFSKLASAIADALVANKSLLEPFGPKAGCTLTATLSESCISELTKNLYVRITSRPISTDVTSLLSETYNSTVGNSDEKLANMLAVLFQLPEVYFQDLTGTDDVNFQMAGELARLAWNSFPDASLLQRASAGELRSPTVLRSEIERVMEDQKARRAIRTFSEQWLSLYQVKDFSYSSDFLSGQVANAALRLAMINEILDFIEYIVFDQKGSYSDLLTSSLARVENVDLAKIYNVTASPNWQKLPNRTGLLTRAGLLATGKNEPHTIFRGVRITREILCNDIPNPPPSAIDMRPTGIVRTNYSNREYTDIRTSGTSCMGCHSKINPLAHSLGGFDGIGRLVTVDRVFDEVGRFARQFPVDSTSRAIIDGDEVSIAGHNQLASLIAASRQAPKCLSTQLVRYYAGRHEASTDTCGIEQAGLKLNAHSPIVNVVTQWIEDELTALQPKGVQ
ncbi:MAG: DUF1592 domain-containing protein [Bdellovibrionales bacterium]